MHPIRTYRIETERLVIRCYEPKDAAMLLESITASLEHLLPWMAWAEHEPTSLEAKIALLRKARADYDLGQDGMMGIWDKTETTFIGSTGLHDRVKGNAIEIGYWIDARQTGKGYMTEAVAALSKVSFEIEQWDRVEIHCNPANIASARIPEKLGYTHEGTLKKRIPGAKGERVDEIIWSLFREDYQQLPVRQTAIKAFDVVGREMVG